MKTFFTHIQKKLETAILATCLFFSQSGFTQPDYNFGTGSLETGSYRAINSVYRFPNVKTDVDGLVTIKAIVNATIDSVDRNGIGHKEAFQPSIYANANSYGYVEFELKFVTAGTSTPVLQSVINVTSIDVDGSSPANDPNYVIYEFDEYNFPSGAVIDYSLTGAQLNYSTSGSWIKGQNTGGSEYLDVDTVAKEVMFTMIAQNQSTFLVRMGADNKNNANSYRLRSLYFKKFDYPSSRVLPVKLSGFTAGLKRNRVVVKWETVSEVNVNYFMVEKSTDGQHYMNAGLVFANGNAYGKTAYSMTDDLNTLQSGVLYYRLRSVDIDGKSQLSEVRIIRIVKQNDNGISIVTYPNPVTNELRITNPASWQNKQVIYELFNENGSVVKRTTTGNSSQTETMHVSNLSPGFYILKATANGELAQQKIIKH